MLYCPNFFWNVLQVWMTGKDVYLQMTWSWPDKTWNILCSYCLQWNTSQSKFRNHYFLFLFAFSILSQLFLIWGCNFRHQEGSRTVAHPVWVQAIFWDSASQVSGSAHVLSSSVHTLQQMSILWMLRGRGCARDGTERGKWIIPGPLGFSSSLEMF